MKIVFCKWFPFKGYKAITILKWIIVRKDAKVAFTSVDYNHECIHYEQEKELLYIGFYLLYVLEFLVKLLYYRKWHKAYRSISFEREAYTNQYNTAYTVKRNKFAWRKYLKQRTNERY